MKHKLFILLAVGVLAIVCCTSYVYFNSGQEDIENPDVADELIVYDFWMIDYDFSRHDEYGIEHPVNTFVTFNRLWNGDLLSVFDQDLLEKPFEFYKRPTMYVYSTHVEQGLDGALMEIAYPVMQTPEYISTKNASFFAEYNLSEGTKWCLQNSPQYHFVIFKDFPEEWLEYVNIPNGELIYRF